MWIQSESLAGIAFAFANGGLPGFDLQHPHLLHSWNLPGTIIHCHFYPPEGNQQWVLSSLGVTQKNNKIYESRGAKRYD